MLARFLSPHRPEDFFERFWAAASMKFRPDVQIVGLEEVDDLLASSGSTDRKIGVVSNGQFVSHTRLKGFHNESLYRGLAAGSTLVCNGVHDVFPRARFFCHELGEALGARSWMNLYITPDHQQGFPPHVDDHHVFAVQVSGSKKWILPTGEVTLAEGDGLYIPQGMEHHAVAEVFSVHLSIGVRLHSLGSAMESLLRLPRIRDQLGILVPHRFASDAEKQNFLAGLAGELCGVLQDNEFDLLEEIYQAGSRPDSGRFLSMVNAFGLAQESCLRLRPDSSSKEVPGGTHLARPGGEFVIPGLAVQGFLCSSRSAKVENLPGNSEVRLRLARRMIFDRFVDVVY